MNPVARQLDKYAMTLKKRGQHWYGENHADIRDELFRYSKLNGYLIDAFTDVKCKCGHDEFQFLSDEDEGVAVRICTRCGALATAKNLDAQGFAQEELNELSSFVLGVYQGMGSFNDYVPRPDDRQFMDQLERQRRTTAAAAAALSVIRIH